jgi:hypothetical protein
MRTYYQIQSLCPKLGIWWPTYGEIYTLDEAKDQLLIEKQEEPLRQWRIMRIVEITTESEVTVD